MALDGLALAVRRRFEIAAILTLMGLHAATAYGQAENDPRVRTLPRSPPHAEPEGRIAFVPRFALLELQYPQLVAASGGAWAKLNCTKPVCPGLVGDLEIGLSGATVALGPGVVLNRVTSYENAGSFGVQGTIHRTWPWWSPWLATSTTFVGGEVFAHYFAVRCSAGVMWAPSNSVASSPFLVGGCGLATP
jgi:hypothetical protein